MDISEALSPEHYTEIMIESAVDPEVATQRGYRTLAGDAAERAELADMGFRPKITENEGTYPALLIPMHGATGEVRSHQIKPAVPRVRAKADGVPSPIKYETPPGAPSVVDVPAFTRSVLESDGTPLWITEGMKKTDALCSQGLAALGLTGVFNWRSKMGALGDWEDIPIKTHPWVICFDSDAAGNRNVQLAMTRLGAWLKSRGAPAVHYLITPAKVGETETKGIDDYLAAGGDLATLKDTATTTPPGGGAADASFTDAYLVEEVCSGALDGRFCWSSGLGWMKWDGRVWADVSDTEPVEAVRQWALAQFEGVLAEQRSDASRQLGPQIAGWRSVLGKARLRALVDLSRGIIERYADDFDSDPDLLTVKNGTLHLPSGRLLAFDAAHSITKMAGAEYREGASHPFWDKALSALPEGLHEWYRDRLGQALTGYKTPDHKLVLAYGSGSNGKSTIVSTVRAAVGAYGVQISDRVLMASPDAHPTELMDLRGARYAVLEETPEARHLNVQRLKTTLGTETIVARRIRQDPVEFASTHSLFINTNYRPQVTETDHGTWRRLALLTFPYTYRSRPGDITGPTDRLGDSDLEYAHLDPRVRAACLAWMAEGARAWYGRGRRMLPVPDGVEDDTKQWRAETDLIMGFTDECLSFDPEAFTPVQKLLSAFNEWSSERGHRPWNDKTFANRFGSHDVIKGARVTQGRKYVDGRQQRVWHGVAVGPGNGTAGPFDGGPMPRPDEDPCDHPNGFGSSGCPCGAMERDDPEETAAVAQLVLDIHEHGPVQHPEPVALGFDIETASADEMFRGRHEGWFVRLVGSHVEDPSGGSATTTTDDPSALVDDLNRADVIYGHNILKFDLVALAAHHGADYDALAAKAVDTYVLAQLADPPGAKGMKPWSSRGYFGLDQVAQRMGHTGKSDDLKALADEFGGYDRIPVDDPRYAAYLRGDLAATQAVYAGLGLDDYARREMRVAAVQNRMTLNGWAVDTERLAERVAHEDAQREESAARLHSEYGMPLAPPDKIKLKRKADWPQPWPISDVRQLDAETQVREGFADRVPQEPYAAPWNTRPGKAAIIAALAAAGAPHYPRTRTGEIALGKDAMGAGDWYDAAVGVSRPGMLKAYPPEKFPEVASIVGLVTQATGATAKYAEIATWMVPGGRVHAETGDVQASGRWATRHPATANLDPSVRSVFLPDPGHVLLTCDLAAVDVRAMAGHSQDPELIARLQPGMDYHSEMAEIFFGDRSKRNMGKPISHGLNYGQGARAISERNGLDLGLVARARAQHKETFHVLAGWTENLIERAGTGALLDNGFGRLMRCDPQRAYTQAPALMGQGAARDIMTESLLKLVEFGKWAGTPVTPYLRGVVHDEVILSVPEEHAEYWTGALRDAFTWEWKGVPILCSVSNPGRNWLECKH